MIEPPYFTEKIVCHGDPIDDAYAQRNFKICRAVDLLKVGIVLDDMIEAGLPRNQARAFKQAAESLLALMQTENNRLRADALETRTAIRPGPAGYGAAVNHEPSQ